jgi:hypothetical protein
LDIEKKERKLCFAGSALPETELIVMKEVMIVEIRYDITDNDLFKDLA